MAGLIKNQILKHLSKFTKNLSPDKIHVSTLKGEGDLSNLELDEKVLTELLDLPTWLTLTRAVCNRVAIKIQWTKLKSQPICVFLDEIEVEMVTCEDIRTPSAQSPLADLSSSGKYGLAERIVDGMYVSINSVVVNFKAKAFHASIQLSRIIIQSKTPIWDRSGDLRTTRIKDEVRGEILLFKEAEWQTLRIEANALEGSNLATTPLRLIANQSKTRITIKKRLIDCGIVASRLLLTLDDLLWVLTDSQLKAALAFINSLKDVVHKSAQQSKLLAAEKIRKQGFTPSRQAQQAAAGGKSGGRPASKSEQAIAKLFTKYDIGETSYHLHSGRIDLHLCEDPSTDEDLYRKKVDGGAIQMTFLKMCFDYYPFHPAGGERTHWLKYDENMAARDTWASELLQTFRDDVRKVRTLFSPSQQPSPAQHGDEPTVLPPGGRNTNHLNGGIHHHQQQHHPPTRPNSINNENPVNHTGNTAPNHHQASGNQGQQRGTHQASFQAAAKHTRLLENSFIFRLEDFAIFQVSSATDSRRRAPPKKFLSSEKKQLWLPQEMSSIHVEYTDYYFPEGIDFPGAQSDDPSSVKVKQVQSNVQGALEDDFLACAPHGNMYMVVNPIKLTLDYLTLLWLNTFSLNISNSLNIPKQTGPTMHTDIRLDALMPRVVVPGEEQEYPEQIDRPTSLQLQMSRLMLTNCRQGNRCSCSDLKELLQAYAHTKLLHKQDFPCSRKQLDGLPPCLVDHAGNTDHAYFDKVVEDVLLDREMPKSFSDQCLEDLLVNSYSQNSVSSPSNTGDNSKTAMAEQCTQKSSHSHHHNRGSSIGSAQDRKQTSSSISDSMQAQTTGGDREMSDIGGRRKVLVNQDSVSSVGLTYYNMRTDSFKKDMRKDVWCAVIDQVWVEFLGSPSARGRPLPLLESFPLTLWIAFPKRSQEADEENGIVGRTLDNTVSSGSLYKATDQGDPLMAEKPHKIEKSTNAMHHAGFCNGDNDTIEEVDGEEEFESKQHQQQQENAEDRVLADLHVIAKVGGQIHLQISHYQYLFLMRLVDTVTNFQNELQQDTEQILGKSQSQKTIGLSIMIREAELAMVCLPNKDEFANDDSSVGNSSDLTQEEAVTMTSQDLHHSPQRQSGQDSALGASFQSHRDKCPSDPELVSPSSSEELPIDELVRQATEAMTASDMDLNSTGTARKTSVQSQFSEQTPVDSTLPPGMSVTSLASLTSRENSPAICVSEAGPHYYEKSGGSGKGTPQDSPAHHRGGGGEQYKGQQGKAGQDVKKSLTTGISSLGNRFSSLGSKLKDKVNMARKDSELEEGEDWETVSVQSSDDEDYLLLKYQNEEELPAFDKQYGGVGEAGSDDNSQVLDDTSKRARGTVSVLTFKLYQVEAFVQLVEKDVQLALQVDHLIPEELGNIDLDKFQERFSADPHNSISGLLALLRKTRGIKNHTGTNTLHTDIPPPLAEAPIQLCFSQGPRAELLAPTAGDRGFIHCKVRGLQTRLPVSGLTSLTDLIEDEKHSPVLPLLAEISDSFITLQDSRSTTYAHSVEKIPLDLHISSLSVRRTEDGVMHIMGDTLATDPPLDAKYWKQKCIQTTPSIEHPPTARTINYVSLGLSSRATNQGAAATKEGEHGVETEGERRDYNAMVEENEQLRRQLERIGKLSSQTGGIDAKSLETLQKECEHLKSKANRADRLQRENRALMEQLTRQVDDIFTMKEERESLLATIQMLQEELAESEQMRMALKKGGKSGDKK